MGHFRFRKSFNILPGVKLNLNKNSMSVTAGVRGAHVTVNSKGQRTLSAGIPGTGLSYRDTRTMGKAKAKPVETAPEPAPAAHPDDANWRELHNSTVNGTALMLITNIAHDSPNFFLYANDGTGWETVGIYIDIVNATDDVLRWEIWLQNGGTVAEWVARTHGADNASIHNSEETNA